MCWRVLVGLCLLWARAFAGWPNAPKLDVNAECPKCPPETASESDWENYRVRLDEFRKSKLELFWTEVNTAYRLDLERQRKMLELELNSGHVSVNEYRSRLDEYRSRMAKISGDLWNTYYLGLGLYHNGIDLYKTAIKELEKSQYDMPGRDAGDKIYQRCDWASSAGSGSAATDN